MRTSGTPRISIDGSGNISLAGDLATTGTVDGIDIAARDAILTSTTSALSTKLPLAGGTMTGALTVKSPSTTGEQLILKIENAVSTGAIGKITFNQTNDEMHLSNEASGSLVFDVAAAEKMRIDTSGNIIMTAGGTIRAGGVNDLILDAGESGTPDMYFQSGGSTKIKIEGSNGKVYIGATSGEANLVVRDQTNGTHKGGRIGFGIHEAGALQIYDAVTMSRTAGSTVTDSTASGGENVTLSSGQLYGPYHTLPRGSYRLCVKMKTTDASYDGDAARLTLHTSSATVIPESRTVKGVDFGTNNKWQTFSVPFQVVGAATNAVEFYLFALNSQAISVDYFFIMNDTDSYSTKVYGDQVVDGHIGIGHTPSTYLTSGYKLRLNGGSQTYIAFNNSTHTTQVLGGFVIGADATAARITQRENQPIMIKTNDTVRMTITADGRIGFGEQAGNSGHQDVEGKMDIRMDMSGVNWIENDWASVFNAAGTPGANFNKAVLHLDTNRFGGATGGIVGIAFSPGWQGHQNWGIYSHNRSGGSHSEGDLSFVNQINAGNIQERFRIRADGLTVFPTGFASTPRTFEKAMQRGFANGVANEKCYLVLGTEFWGELEVSLTGTYSNQNMAGILKRSYALGLNTSGTVYANDSHTVREEGFTANNFAIGEVEYDSTLGRYKIPIAHINTAGNAVEVVIKATLASSNQAYLEGMQNAYLTSVITTNTTVYKKQTRESACHVYHTGGQAITATPLALSFTSTLFDPGDCFSGSEYTAPEHGIYAFNVSYLVYPHSSGVCTSSWQKYTGGGWSQYGAGIQQDHGNNNHTMISYPTLIELSKGEKVRAMLAIGGYSGTPTMYGGQNSFTAHKV